MRRLALLGFNFLRKCGTRFKLGHLFGLIPWAARALFYLLQLYIAPAVIWMGSRRPLSSVKGSTLGVFCTLPPILWRVATKCIPAVQITYALSGVLQGAVIAWLSNNWLIRGSELSSEAQPS